ncbi:sigma-70 family RNA polymerase sigma factor [Reichenbachiella sp. MALMAid0571]|uniref:RNA polymerase sigma factor n=1 Tax=Reichenbachiella sp. MALMAid0571 TaxID=3143939 RepID=UPI0032E00178
MDLNNLISVKSAVDFDKLKSSLSDTHSDIDLWTSIREGSSESLVKLYKRHYHILYSYGMKTCADSEQTKDCIQELFAKIWASRNNLNKVKKVRSYLLQSLWNALIKEKKKIAHRKDEFNYKEFQFDAVFSFEQTLIDEEEEKIRNLKVEKSLSTLNKNQKEVIYMMFYEGLSYKEIALRKSINSQSAKNIVHRAIQKLRSTIIGITAIMYFPFY